MASSGAIEPPGVPGTPARWTSSAKTGVGTALAASSRIWFTISHGILNEIYFPRIDIACTRDLGFLVTDRNGYFSEEKRDTDSQVDMIEQGIPAFRLVNTARDGRYRIEKRIVTDPLRESLLQQICFEPLRGKISDYRLYVLIAPHLLNAGAENTGWIGDYKEIPMLFASRQQGISLALASSAPWVARSVGYVGASDGWQLLSRNRELDERYRRAENGNVALCGEIDLAADNGCALVSLGFGGRPEEAGHRALASLQGGFDTAGGPCVAGWRALPRARAGPASAGPAGGPLQPERLSGRPCRAGVAPGPLVSGGRHRHPVDPLGLYKRRRGSRRLSSGLAARSRRDRGRISRSGRGRRGEIHPRLSDDHSGGGRALVAERVARRPAVLGRCAD